MQIQKFKQRWNNNAFKAIWNTKLKLYNLKAMNVMYTNTNIFELPWTKVEQSWDVNDKL